MNWSELPSVFSHLTFKFLRSERSDIHRAHKCAQSFSRDPERLDAKLGKEITSQVPRTDTINGGIKALVV